MRRRETNHLSLSTPKRSSRIFVTFVVLFKSADGLLQPETPRLSKRHGRQLSLPPLFTSSDLNPASRTWSQKRPSLQTTELIQRTTPSIPHGTTLPARDNYLGQRTISNPIINDSSSKAKPERRKLKTKAMPVTGYDPQTLENHYDRQPFKVGWRLNSIGFPLLAWYLGLITDKALGIGEREDVQRKRGAELRNHLVRSKSVALIKSGQALSLRPDLIRNKIWAEELGKLVDAVGSFSDVEAMRIIRKELVDVAGRLDVTKSSWKPKSNPILPKRASRLEKIVAYDNVLSLFEFYNNAQAVASASIGQVYKARIKRGPQLEAAIGKDAANIWGGKMVAIKVQRPDVEESAALDMYLLRRTALWLSKVRGGDLTQVADAFGMQLFGELDYVREADNCERFRALYDDWNDIKVPSACIPLTRRRVLVMEWIDGEKGPWPGQSGIQIVRTGLRCCVDQLMTTGLFHADPHRGNLLKTPDNKLAFIDFGMMADIDEEERYGLFGLVIGLQNKDLPLVTENLLKLGFLKDTTQLDQLIPRLRRALIASTGGTGRASDVNFATLQAELDSITRENILQFSTPAFFTIIIRSLTILEGVALSVDKNFKLVRGAYPYVLSQLLNPQGSGRTPEALRRLLIRLLTVNGDEKEIEWERLRDFLLLAQKASKRYDPSAIESEAKGALSRKSIELLGQFFMSRTGLFLKKPLVHELAESIDGLASIGEANLMRRGLLPALPGMNGPVNGKRLDEIRVVLNTFQEALLVDSSGSSSGKGKVDSAPRMEAIMELFREASSFLADPKFRENSGPLLEELQSVAQSVAVEVLEIRGSRAVRSILRVPRTLNDVTTI
ncbi:hypothetical protein MPSEU_000233900 [Mayamaea pseudoterrestris]|nr:hypothetical protein MPSEU_000233900 [Mayamaea pseudoterrestris]